MKKTFTVAMFMAIFFSAAILFAAEEKNNDWKPISEASVGVQSGLVDDYSGELLLKKSVVKEMAMVGLGKGDTGFYIQGQNYSPSQGETKYAWLYAGFYTKLAGANVDAGYAYYWTREKSELDYHGVYAEVTFPETKWQLVPFVKAEYRFAKKLTETSGSQTDMNGLLYLGGLKRQFKLYERVNLIAEFSVGGNAGIYGLRAENLAYAREQIGVEFTLSKQWKIAISTMTQQILGQKDGVAAGTDKLFVSAAVTWAL